MRFVRYFLVCLTGLLLMAPLSAAAAAGQQTMSSPAQPEQPSGPVHRLSIDEAVQLALKNNLGLEVERLNPQIEQESIAQARAAYLPNLQVAFQTNGSTSQPGSFTEGNVPYDTDSLSSRITFTQNSVPWTNTQVSATWQGSRTTTTIFAPPFNPRLGASFNVTATQPLLRDFLVNPVRNQVQQAVLARQIADINLRERVVATERTVRQAYWNLVGAIERLDVARQNLDLSNEQLRANRVRVEVGTMAPIDIVAAQAEVAGNEEAVITAQAAIRTAEDQLRTLIFDPNAEDFWTARIEPTNEPLLQPMDVNVEAAIRTALESRTDIVGTRRQLQISDLSLRLSKNQTLPDLSLQASFTGTASGGTQYAYDFGSDIPNSEVIRSFGDTLGDVFKFVYPTWSVAAQFSYPIGKEAAQANYARARLQREQADVQMKQLEVGIVQQVRQAARNVETNFQRVQTTRVARELAEQRLEAQQKRFEVGLSTLFELTQAQRDVVLQRNNELNAIIDYNQALVDFQLVQVAPLGGGGF